MIRSDVLKELQPIISDQLVVCNIGLPSQELHNLDDQPSNFYMLGTMGLSSSIGLGLALAQNAKVIAIDGDGSVLTNLCTCRQSPTTTCRQFHSADHRQWQLWIDWRSADLCRHEDLAGENGRSGRM